MVIKNCKTEEEVKSLITELQIVNPNQDEDLIQKAISSCCVDQKNENFFMDCIKERIRIFSLMKQQINLVIK